MALSLPPMVNQVKNLLQGLGPVKLTVLAVLVGVTVAGLVFLLTWAGPQNWQTLYANLNAQDAGQIIEKLKEQKIPYQLAEGGTAIRVANEKLYETRLSLASQGLPRGSGIGFEVFDTTKLGMTEFVQNINYQRALQGELSRTINGFAEVESSRVHIVMPRESLFVEEEDPATASVILKLRPGRSINKDQVQGIVHLVSSSVPRLRPEKITVVDSSGHILSGNQDPGGLEQLTAAQLEFQAKVEKNIESRVKTMLEKVLGQDKAIVRAACLLDFVRQEKTEEKYLADNQVLRSEQNFLETSSTEQKATGGVPGLAANITENAASEKPSETNGGKNYQKQDKTSNYEIGKVTSHQVVPVGRVMNLSVAVIVDGTYRPKPVNEADKKKKDKEGEQLEYVARSEQEMKRIESIVKGAVNFDDKRGDRIEVANIPFVASKTEVEEAAAAGKAGWLQTVGHNAGIFKHVAVAAFMVLAFLFVVRPMVRWLTAVSLDDIQMVQQLPRSIAELEHQYANAAPGANRLSYADRAAQLIATDRQATVELMQGWLKET